MRKPDFIIGGIDNPYMLRWWLIPRNRFFNIYLHKILRDDDDRALHDHPWHSLSIILKGGYLELRSNAWDKTVNAKRCGPGTFIVRKPTTAHRLILDSSGAPCWSLFITGPRLRDWGFHCQKGFVPWQKFLNKADSGLIGKGCDQ